MAVVDVDVEGCLAVNPALVKRLLVPQLLAVVDERLVFHWNHLFFIYLLLDVAHRRFFLRVKCEGLSILHLHVDSHGGAVLLYLIN